MTKADGRGSEAPSRYGATARDPTKQSKRASAAIADNRDNSKISETHLPTVRPELAIIVPTLNERDNVEPLYHAIAKAIDGPNWEIVFVDDDSTDGTLERLDELASRHSNCRFIRRVGRRGLSGACIEGMLATTAPYLAVMDADLQHDETLLPNMLELIKREDLDLVVASRFKEGAQIDNFSQKRERMSHLGNTLARTVLKAELSDPLSGFFMLRRGLLNEIVEELSGKGFKILLDIFASAERPLRFEEVPLHFRERHSGESKLDTLVSLEFLMLIGEKLFGHYVPVRFLLFIMVGLSGVAVHLVALGILFRLAALDFLLAQAIATLTAMTSNFYLNNVFTHRDKKLKDMDFLYGLLTFYVACSVGALINFQIAEFLYDKGIFWLLAGLIGAGVSSIWNYGVTSTFTWRRQAR
jgi:dolichol-phosphate mannosyltransferase